MKGLDILKKIELVGTADGKPARLVKIIDSGEVSESKIQDGKERGNSHKSWLVIHGFPYPDVLICILPLFLFWCIKFIIWFFSQSKRKNQAVFLLQRIVLMGKLFVGAKSL